MAPAHPDRLAGAAPRVTAMRVYDSVVDLIGNTPLVRLHPRHRRASPRDGAGQGRVPEPGRLGEGPHRRRAWSTPPSATGCAEARRHDRRADLRQHRRRAGARRPAARLPLRLRVPRQGLRRQDQRAAGVRRRGRGVPDGRRRRSTPTRYYSVSRPAGAARSRARGSPTSTRTRTTRARTTRRTGPEIWAQTDGTVTHFVAGVGTGGTISGTGRYLKEVSDGRVRVIGADPEGSVYSGGTGRPYLVEGVGEDFWPTAYDRDGLRRDHRGVRQGLLRDDPAAGPRGGPAGRRLVRHGRRWRRCEVAAAAGPDDVVVVLLPDGGRGYLSKVFNDEWMADYGFLAPRGRSRRSATCSRARPARCPPLVHTHPNETVARGDRRSCASTASRRCRWCGPSRR